ncbi:MAG: transglycosylase domain-containing protein [Chloroflexi bacterium]|nr:transglycosylase domain-containing protein [Chloroflexota bacterium]
MQTAPQRVSRSRDPYENEYRTRPTSVGWLALILFLILAGVGIVGAIAVIGAYSFLAADLPPASGLTDYQLPEETIVYDRTGAVELARFGEFKREVVAFEDIPPILLDATTAIEDKTFWENAGFDPVAIAAAGLDSIRGRSRGASTITQQLVRARLLDPDLVQDPDRTIERKLREIIQSIRLTQAFPDEAGKREIISAYLNQNYYGNQAYGVKAAARAYFGISDLSELTPAQAAILAALPKSPSNYDLVRNAVEECVEPTAEGEDCAKSRLVVPADTTIVERRDLILDLLAGGGRTPMSADEYDSTDFDRAKTEEVVLVSQTTPRWLAPHFVWAVRDELATKLCGEESPTCDELERGGLRVTTTLDAELQKVAEKWVKAAVIVPHAKSPKATAKQLGLEYADWMGKLRDKDVRNGALVALDYQTGELVAYVGSADYYARRSTKKFQPKYDVVGKGFRQPGSAFKPFNYAIGIDGRQFTAGTVFMDSGTDFGGGYTPNDADRLERGPVPLRQALQFSLNIPSVKAMALNGPEAVFGRAQEFGMTFRGEPSRAGLTLALGVQETPPVDLVTAYGTLANGGRNIGHTTILKVQDRAGADILEPYAPPEGTQVISPQAAYIVTDVLAGNTNRTINPFWGQFAIRGPDDKRRPATLKTGTNNDAKDLNAYGYIGTPTEQARANGAYALAVGAWNGNSDNTEVSTPAKPVFSIEVTTYVWQGFLQEVSKDWPVRGFVRPETGLVQATIDPFTGFLARAGGPAAEEWFLADTQPRDRLEPDACGPKLLERIGHERKFENWMEADRDWIRRASRGPGTRGGPDGTRVTYFYNGGFVPFGRTWGPLVAGAACGQPTPAPTCFVGPTPDPSGVVPSFALPSPSGSEAPPELCPPASPSASPSPSVEPSVEPTPEPVTPPPVTPEPVTPPPVTPPPVTPPPDSPPPVTPPPDSPAPSPSG